MRIAELKNELENYVVGQEAAIRLFLTTMYNNPNAKVLISGPSGCGKTYLVDLFCKIIGKAVCHIDASKLTQTGFAGRKVEEYISEFVNSNSGNISLVESGVIFIDEFDKIAISPSQGENSEIANVGVQYELLKLFDGGELLVDYNHRRVLIDTSKIPIICAGAFSRSETSIVSQGDLVNHGFINELAGRINSFISVEHLAGEMLLKILHEHKCKEFERLAKAYETIGETISFGEAEMKKIAFECAGSPFGVRALDNAIYNFFRDEYFELLMKHNVEF